MTLCEGMKLKQKIKAAALVECSAIKKENIDAVFRGAVRATIEEEEEEEESRVCTIL